MPNRLIFISAFLIALAAPLIAAADWRRAESERFVVYSDGSERDLRAYVQKLETFDRVLRLQMNLPMDEPPARKLPIYLVSGRAGLLKVYPPTQAMVAGTYFPTTEDVFAVAIRREGDFVMLHEYTHHFMLANFPYGYPSWFVEGFAEYFMTAEIVEGRVDVGEYNEDRAYWLMQGRWLPIETLLSNRPGELTRREDRETYYPVAWLLTHWFYADEDRRGQLNVYLRDVGGGGDPVEAMERATGLAPRALEKALRDYVDGRIPYRRISTEFPRVEIAVTSLPRSANDLLLLNQRLKVGVPEDQRAATAEEVRRAAARHGDDSLALLALGHAELHFGDAAVGEATLKRLLEIEPDNVEALQLLATAALKRSRETDDDVAAQAAVSEARSRLAVAYRAGGNDYRTLMLLAELRSRAPDYPTENDLLTLGLAYDQAPQLADVRFNYAVALA